MKIEHLRELLRVAREGSITQAAQKLYLTQATLSSHIESMEKELGFKFFSRSSGKRVVLTSAGYEFIENVQIAINEYDRACEKARSIARNEKPVRVLYEKLPQPLGRVLLALPSGKIEMIQLANERSNPLQPLVDDEADVIILIDYTNNEESARSGLENKISFEPLCELSIGIAMARSNPLARKDQLEIEDLRGKTQIVAPTYLYPSWGDTINAALGGPYLNVIWKPTSRQADGFRAEQLGDCLVFGPLEHLKEHYRNVPGIAYFNRLASGTITVPLGIAYREFDSHPNFEPALNAIRDAFSKAIDGETLLPLEKRDEFDATNPALN